MTTCNHFFIEDRDGAVTGLPYMTVVCIECGFTSTPHLIGAELSHAMIEGHYMTSDHPDFPLMLPLAHDAIERGTIRAAAQWAAGGSCTPITEPPSEPVPVPPPAVLGRCEREPTLWQRVLRFFGIGRRK
jgi:hypothetical protein